MTGLSISAVSPRRLNVQGNVWVEGTSVGLTNARAGTLRINRAGTRLEWAANTFFGVTYLFAAQGVDVGTTNRPTGSVWILAGRDLLYFALDGRAYQVRPRPYDPVSGERTINLSDGNTFGGSSAAFTFSSGGGDLIIPAGKVLRVTSLYVGMSSFRYTGTSYSYAWRLRGTSISRGDTSTYWGTGTPDAPLVILPSGTPRVDFDFNNIDSTNDHRIRIEGVLADS